MKHASRRPAAVALAGAVATAWAGAAQAADWSFVPDAEVGLRHDDNPRLLTEDAEASSALIAMVGAEWERRSESSRHWLDADFRAVDEDDDLLDREEYGLGLNGEWTAERQTYSAGLQWRRDSTLATERGSTGAVEDNRPRELQSLQLAASHELDELTRVSAQTSHRDIRYDNGERFGLNDYGYESHAIQLEHTQSERFRFGVTLSYGRLEPETPGQGDSSDRTALVSTDFTLGPGTLLGLAAGRTVAELETATTEVSQSYQLSLSHRAERMTWRLDASRGYQPTGYGVLARQDNVTAGWEMELTQRARIDAGYSLVNTEYESSALTDASYHMLRLGLSFRMSENLTLAAALNAQQQDYDGHGIGEGNSAQLSFNWRQPAR